MGVVTNPEVLLLLGMMIVCWCYCNDKSVETIGKILMSDLALVNW